VRAEPRDDAEQVTQLLRDEPVTVEEERGGWLRVRTAYGYPGWIRDAFVEGSDPRLGSDTTRPHDGDPVQEARSYPGAPYEWGGMTERGIDCSGLVHMAYRRLGTLIPRDADQQEEGGAPVDEPDARAGDLVTYGDESATHIAFWLGGGRILHSTARDGVDGVVEEPEPFSLRATRRRFVRF
jgi:cell wall-associated NlpC family hydrolase